MPPDFLAWSKGAAESLPSIAYGAPAAVGGHSDTKTERSGLFELWFARLNRFRGQRLARTVATLL
jgi:hypothetical protein